MAYTQIADHTDGQAVPSADFFNLVGDNFRAGIPALMDAKGDLVAATGADAAARVVVGANDALLYSDSGATAGVAWSLRNKVRAKGDSTGQTTLSHTAYVKAIVYDSEDFDVASAFADNRYTCQHAGVYLVGVSGVLTNLASASAAGEMTRVAIYKNGAIYSVVAASVYATAGTINQASGGMDMIALQYGDYVEVWVYRGPSTGAWNADPNWAQFFLSEIG